MSNIIIIPTYNEANNIQSIYHIIRKYAPSHAILFVDGNSQDQTQQEIELLKKQDNNVFALIKAKKEGMGKAYIDGFHWALEKGFTYIQQMDCDLSHHPKFLPLFEQAKENYDFLIGSRYVKGGGSVDWGLLRKITSRLGSLYAGIVLGVNIHDFTGGFNCWHRDVLSSIDLNSIVSKGFSFQIEIKYLAVKHGFQYKEIPYIFENRKVGVSKMSLRIFIEGFWKTILLRFIHKNSKYNK